MKLVMPWAILALLFLSLGCSSSSESEDKNQDSGDVAVAGDAYTIDASASSVEWIGTKQGGMHNGTINISGGSLSMTEGSVASGTITFNMASIASTDPALDDKGNGDLTGHLTSPDFLDIGNHPTGTLTITGVSEYSGEQVEALGEDMAALKAYEATNPTHTVSGSLTIKGESNDINFPVVIESSNNVVKTTGLITIDRKKYNLRFMSDSDSKVNDDICIGVSVTANK